MQYILEERWTRRRNKVHCKERYCATGNVINNGPQLHIAPVYIGIGRCVCCVTSKTGEVPLWWRTGIDHSVDPTCQADDEIAYKENVGEGKDYPGGSTCKYNGKVVDCLVFANESCGISGSILVPIFEHFYETGLFPRLPGGAIPMLIGDGHQSRLDPQFTKYINNQSNCWTVCLGVIYTTTLWQVGGASEQNRKFKMERY